MTQQNLRLYTLAGVVRNEAFLESQLQIAGSNQSRILENLERSKNSTKHQALVMKTIYGILLGFLPIIPLFTYFQLAEMMQSGLIPVEINAFVSTLLMAIYFGMTFMYMLILGLISMSGFMSGEVFEWMEILPISRSNLRKVSFIVLWRFFDIPLLIVMIVFPVLMTWATASVLVFFTCLGVSLLNTLCIFCTLILITEKFSRVIKGTSNSRKASFARIVAMLGYMIVVMTTSLVFNWAMQSIGNIISSFVTLENPSSINLFLSLIPFPFAPGYLVAIALLPIGTAPLSLLGTTLLGIGFLVILTWKLYTTTGSRLRNLTSHQVRVESSIVRKSVTPLEIYPIVPVSPIKAFARKDFASLTRDLQGFMYLVMPIVYPFLMFLPSLGSPGVQLMRGMEIYGFVSIFAVMLTLLNSGMLVSGLLSMEDSGASILASLPIISRDQAIAKLKIICTIQLISSLIPIAVTAGHPEFSILFPFFLSYSLVSMTVVLFTFTAKVRLFGKLRYKYVLEEANATRKVLKWASILVLDGVFLVSLFLVVFFMGDILTTVGVVVLQAILGGTGLGVVIWVLERMFPRPGQKKISKS